MKVKDVHSKKRGIRDFLPDSFISEKRKDKTQNSTKTESRKREEYERGDVNNESQDI